MRWVAPIWLSSPPPINPQFIFKPSAQADLAQILKIRLRIRERRSSARRIAVLLHRSPSREAGRGKRTLEGEEVDYSIAQIAEEAGGARIVEPNSLIDGSSANLRIDVLEMQVGDTLAVPAIEGHGIEARVLAMTGIQAHAQQLRPYGIEDILELILKFDEARGMRVHRDFESEFLRAELSDRLDPVQESRSLRSSQSLGLTGAAGGRGAARRNRIDQYQPLRVMGRQRAAGPVRRIPHLGPLCRIMERAKQHCSDQRQSAFGECRTENRGIFGHEPQGSQLDARVSGRLRLVQHASPGRIARIVCKFDAP